MAHSFWLQFSWFVICTSIINVISQASSVTWFSIFCMPNCLACHSVFVINMRSYIRIPIGSSMSARMHYPFCVRVLHAYTAYIRTVSLFHSYLLFPVTTFYIILFHCVVTELSLYYFWLRLKRMNFKYFNPPRVINQSITLLCPDLLRVLVNQIYFPVKCHGMLEVVTSNLQVGC